MLAEGGKTSVSPKVTHWSTSAASCGVDPSSFTLGAKEATNKSSDQRCHLQCLDEKVRWSEVLKMSRHGC